MDQKAMREKIWLPRNDIDAPSKGILCEWVREGDETSHEDSPLIDMPRYLELLSVVPDKVAENLEKSRLARDGRLPMFKAGLGCVDLLASVIVDFPAVASSAAETKLAPSYVFNRSYLQPGGAPTKTIRFFIRGRETTLTTAATMTFRSRIAATDIITGNTVMASGAITQDTTAQTATMWEMIGEFAVRTVGSTGTVQGMGHADMSAAALTIANQQAKFMGSAGSATPSTTIWDMNNDQWFQITAQWSLATAYSIQTHNYTLEALN